MRKVIFILFQALIFASLAYGQSAGDFLILNDIGQYKLTKGLLFRGKIVGAEPKVSKVGNDVYGYYTSYETSYAGGEGYSAPTVEVRAYDSIQWLLHEVDSDFRSYYGIPTESYSPMKIDGQTILDDSVSGETYRWLSGNKVIEIKYRDLEMIKPEPLEVVKAYLAKHPSTIPAMTLTQLRSPESKTTWIKDEMDRRLWLGDKWFYQLQLGKVPQSEVLQQAVKSMNVFLDYREKYFGMKAADDKNLLAGYVMQNNGTGIKAKLKEYKDWWALNKDKAITLP
jgi:hypothetical protein